MNTPHCCHHASEDRCNVRRPASLWRRGAELVGWIVPSTALVLMPKCPVCVAMYLALFTGMGFSVTSASDLRTGVIILCIFALLCLTVKSLFRLARQKEHY